MKKREGTRDNEKAALTTTTELDREYDIVEELTAVIDEIEKTIERSETEKLEESFSYIRFLLEELNHTLSGRGSYQRNPNEWQATDHARAVSAR